MILRFARFFFIRFLSFALSVNFIFKRVAAIADGEMKCEGKGVRNTLLTLRKNGGIPFHSCFVGRNIGK